MAKLSDLNTSEREGSAARGSATPLPRELEAQEEGLAAGAPRRKETAATRDAGAPPPHEDAAMKGLTLDNGARAAMRLMTGAGQGSTQQHTEIQGD